jgi:serine phosphatase RsbU (regulator of sigma subunit)
MFKSEGHSRRLVLPGEVLSHVNRKLLGLVLEDLPLVAMLVAQLNTQSGELLLARAGIPAPVFLPAHREPQLVAAPGPFLGTADASYPTVALVLGPGDRLVIGTDGTRPDGTQLSGENEALLDAVKRHRTLSRQHFADAIANDLLARVKHSDDLTVLAIELTPV